MQNERERQRKLEAEADFIYQEGLRDFEGERWEEARLDFLDVQKVLPGYKKTEEYLDKTDANIERAAMKRRQLARDAEAQRKKE